MTRLISLNADVGEDDTPAGRVREAALIGLVQAVSIACGGHAGDGGTMRRTASWALDAGTSIGAHPSFPDREGFGRRPMEMAADDLENGVTEQIRALADAAAAAGHALTHMKPHGALYTMAVVREDYARALVAATQAADPRLVVVTLPGSKLATAAADAGLPVAFEAFPDRAYDDDGRLAARGGAGAVIHDPAEAARRAVAMATTGGVASRSGRRIALPCDTLCIHGDEAGAADVARAVRAALEAADVRLVSLAERVAARAGLRG